MVLHLLLLLHHLINSYMFYIFLLFLLFLLMFFLHLMSYPMYLYYDNIYILNYILAKIKQILFLVHQLFQSFLLNALSLHYLICFPCKPPLFFVLTSIYFTLWMWKYQDILVIFYYKKLPHPKYKYFRMWQFC